MECGPDGILGLIKEFLSIFLDGLRINSLDLVKGVATGMKNESN